MPLAFVGCQARVARWAGSTRPSAEKAARQRAAFSPCSKSSSWVRFMSSILPPACAAVCWAGFLCSAETASLVSDRNRSF
jgi:hypothetical protein